MAYAEQFGSFGGLTPDASYGAFGDMSPKEGSLSGMSDEQIILALSAYREDALTEGRDEKSAEVIGALKDQVLKIAIALIRDDETIGNHDEMVAELVRLSEDPRGDMAVTPDEFCQQVGATLREIVDMKN